MAVHSDRAFAAARRLRKSPTGAERAAWTLLRGKAVEGLRFRRQVPLGSYVVDFCCLSHRIVVEIDGGVHRLKEGADSDRDAWLSGQGFLVLRFSNETVLGQPHRLLEAVRQAARTPHPSRSASHLPPQGGKETA